MARPWATGSYHAAIDVISTKLGHLKYPPASVRAFIDWIIQRRTWDFTKLGPPG